MGSLIGHGLNQRIDHANERIAFWKGHAEEQIWKGILQELTELKTDIEEQITNVHAELKRIEGTVPPGSGAWTGTRQYMHALQLVVYGE